MLSLITTIFIALIIPGIIARTRAIISGRKGVTLYQHIDNVALFMKKSVIYAPVTSFISHVAPIVYLGSAITAALLIPVGGFEALISFRGDIVLLCYLLGLGRIALIMAAMDTGSSFQGMGASREALYGALVEPALFILFGTLALVSGYTDFTSIFLGIGENRLEMIVVMVILFYTLFKVIAVEAGRIPIDDTRTHLELTMIHEVMILDYCGFDLGLITIAGWIKTAVIAVIAASALCATFYYNTLVIILLCVVMAIIIGVVESLIARNKLSRNTTYILTIISLAFVLFMVGFVILQNINI